MSLGYTTRSKVEKFQNRTFTEVSDVEFDEYISQAESYINNYLGYNAGTTTSGILTQSVVREKVNGKIDQFDNLIVDVMHPPIHFDQNNNPMVTLLEFNMGGIRVPLQLTDGSSNTLNTLLEVSENRRKIIYPSIYFFPAISTVTPTAKVNLFHLRDVKFWVDVSYVGGYDTTPGDITTATNLITGDILINRDNVQNASRISQGSYSIEWAKDTKSGLTPAFSRAHTLLQPYVRYTW